MSHANTRSQPRQARHRPVKTRKRPHASPAKKAPPVKGPKHAGKGTAIARGPRTKAVWEGTKGQLVTLSGLISQAAVRKLARVFENYTGPITICISTPGGDLDAAMALHELIRLRVESGQVVMTFGVGVVMSAGVLILCAGTKGHRIMTKFTRVLYHESATSIAGPLSRIRGELKALEDTDGDYDSLCAEYTGRPLAEVRGLYAQGDAWLDATACKAFGFVDRVV